MHGRIASNGAFLQLVLGDAWFAWLRPLSQLMVRLDALDEEDQAAVRAQITALFVSVQTLLMPSEEGNGSGTHYYVLERELDVGAGARGGQSVHPVTVVEQGVQAMKAHYLGHVVFYVKGLEQSLAFYRDLLGFEEVGRIFSGTAAALTSGRTHHELLLIEVGDAPGPLPGSRRGLYHIGIKVGNSLDALRAAKKEFEQAGVTIDGMSDHTVSQSLYLQDPDGNEVEFYVDADESVWKSNPTAVVSRIKPLRL